MGFPAKNIMAKFCPVQNRKVLYLECLECEQKECRKEKKYEKRDLRDNDDSKTEAFGEI